VGLFKSKDERRIEREMRIKAGLRAVERAIRQQDKFAEDFARTAREARRIGDDAQYRFVRAALRRTSAAKKLLERQLLAMKSAVTLQQQAAAGAQFAEAMRQLARDVAASFGQTDLTRTQAEWERAVTQAATLEARMDLFLTSMQQQAITADGPAESVSDEDIDRLIDADVLAAERGELAKLDELEGEIARELGRERAG
jgi:hypothetical protein